jgi:hypothetical protein
LGKEHFQRLPEWLKFNVFYRAKLRQNSGEWEDSPHVAVHPHDANLISSQGPDGKHKLMLDLDQNHWYTESSSKGHGHLVIDTSLEPWQMQEIIEVLAKHGVLQQGIERQWNDRQCLTLRMPGMKKNNEEDGMGFEELKAIGKEPKPVPHKTSKLNDLFDMFKF